MMELIPCIEADQGLPEDIAHFYFTQLVSGVSWLHGKGVAHRGMNHGDKFGCEVADDT